MELDAQLTSGGETIELQQQVFRLQALLEASRQVHSTIREEEVLEAVLRIVVRELEMDGAEFPGSGLAYGRLPGEAAADAVNPDRLLIYPLADRDGRKMIDLVVASVTISLGMMQLPPVMISAPFKILLFVLVDGWNLVVGSLVRSFYPT